MIVAWADVVEVTEPLTGEMVIPKSGEAAAPIVTGTAADMLSGKVESLV